MKLSDDKITHMTHVVLKALLDKGIIDITEEEGTVRRAMKRTEMGLEPGPIFRDILQATLDARLNGQVKTRKDELEFARDRIP